MPLRVHCPSGCLIHMSTQRAGRIVRCPQCKVAIRIPAISENELASGNPIPCQARIAKRRSDLEQDPAPTNVDSPLANTNLTSSAAEQAAIDPSAVEKVVMDAAIPPVAPPGTVTKHQLSKKLRLAVPDLVKPVINRRRPLRVPDTESSPELESLERVHQVPEFENDESRETTDQEIAAPLDAIVSKDAIDVQDPIESQTQTTSWSSAKEISQKTVPLQESSDVESSVGESEISHSEMLGSTTNESMAEEVAVQEVAAEESVEITPAIKEPESKAPDRSFSPPPLVETETVEPETAQPSTVVPEAVELVSAEPEIEEPESVEEFEETGSPASELVESISIPLADPVPDKIDFLPKPTRAHYPATIPIISLEEPTQSEYVAEEERDWETRLESANSDRRMLARFFALVLCLVAIVNMVPAFYHWFHWTQMTESLALPRWIYIQVFVGAIHLVYAIFLFQINNWSAMRAVSVAMLGVAFVFGFISTGLLVGGGEGNLTGFLGIPYTLSRQACIWCVAMLCLATLMSYWGGKESTNWQRAEHLLKEILSKSAA